MARGTFRFRHTFTEDEAYIYYSYPYFAAEGLINYLIKDKKAEEILQKYTFKIVPMVSIESVIAGAPYSANDIRKCGGDLVRVIMGWLKNYNG